MAGKGKLRKKECVYVVLSVTFHPDRGLSCECKSENLLCISRVLQNGGRAAMSKASTGQSLTMVEHPGALSRPWCLPQTACQPGALYYIQM